MSTRIIITAAAALACAACGGNVTRSAATGAVVGAAAGAVIGNNTGDGDAGEGAAIGAGVGAVAGAVHGMSQDQRAEECRRIVQHPQYWDEQARAYYFYVPGTNRTCWADGVPRG